VFLRYLGLSLRRVSRAISPFVSRSYNVVWGWGERLRGFRDTFARRCRVSMYLVDDTVVWVGFREA
jgi:hypothetical protein